MAPVKNFNPSFTAPLRAIFALVAIATLFEQRPWAQSNMLASATTYAGALMWAAIAAFGNRSGWPRHVTMALALIYLVLVIAKIAGFAA